MNYNGDNKGKQGNHNHNPLKHMLHMVLCCGLPIVIVGFLPLITKLSSGAGIVVAKIVPFLCPLMMIGMLPMMLRGNKKSSCCDDKNEIINNKLLELNKPAE